MGSSADNVAGVIVGVDVWNLRYAGANGGERVGASGLPVDVKEIRGSSMRVPVYFAGSELCFQLLLYAPIRMIETFVASSGCVSRIYSTAFILALKYWNQIYFLLLSFFSSHKAEIINRWNSPSGGRISNIIALLHFELVAVFVDRLSWLEFRLGYGIVEWVPEIGVEENGINAFEGCYGGRFVD